MNAFFLGIWVGAGSTLLVALLACTLMHFAKYDMAYKAGLEFGEACAKFDRTCALNALQSIHDAGQRQLEKQLDAVALERFATQAVETAKAALRS